MGRADDPARAVSRDGIPASDGRARRGRQPGRGAPGLRAVPAAARGRARRLPVARDRVDLPWPARGACCPRARRRRCPEAPPPASALLVELPSGEPERRSARLAPARAGRRMRRRGVGLLVGGGLRACCRRRGARRSGGGTSQAHRRQRGRRDRRVHRTAPLVHGCRHDTGQHRVRRRRGLGAERRRPDDHAHRSCDATGREDVRHERPADRSGCRGRRALGRQRRGRERADRERRGDRGRVTGRSGVHRGHEDGSPPRGVRVRRARTDVRRERDRRRPASRVGRRPGRLDLEDRARDRLVGRARRCRHGPRRSQPATPGSGS